MTGKRLSKDKWKQLDKELRNPHRNIFKLAKKYNISRHSIYFHLHNRGLFQKKPKKTFYDKLKKLVKEEWKK